MNECTHTDPLVAQRYYDGELPAREAEAYATHLASCPPCQASLDAWRGIATGLRAAAAPEPPADLTARLVRAARESQLQSSRRIAWGLLTAASLLMASSLFLVLYTQAGEGDTPAFAAQWEEYVVAPPAVDEEYTDLEVRTLVAIHIQEASKSENRND